MYVGQQVRAQVAIATSAMFVCKHCNAQHDVMGTGIGAATANNPLYLDPGAGSRAHGMAFDAAGRNMATSLACAACPSCGKHDAAARARVYVVAALIGILVGGACGFMAVVAAQGSETGWIAGAVIGGVIAIGVAIKRTMSVITPVMFEA